jgi:hypothetical protein
MRNYSISEAPYGQTSFPEGFSAKRYWMAMPLLRGGKRTVLALLAILLQDVAPNAAATERIFSFLKWLQSDRRNRLGIDALAKLSTIKIHYQQQIPQVSRAKTESQRHKARDAQSAKNSAAPANGAGASRVINLADHEFEGPAAAEGEEGETVATAFSDAGDFDEDEMDDLLKALGDAYLEGVLPVELAVGGTRIAEIIPHTMEELKQLVRDQCWRGIDLYSPVLEGGEVQVPAKPDYGNLGDAEEKFDIEDVLRNFL